MKIYFSLLLLGIFSAWLLSRKNVKPFNTHLLSLPAAKRISQIKTDGHLTHTFAYDSLGRLIKMELIFGKVTQQFVYTYADNTFSGKCQVNHLLISEYQNGRLVDGLLRSYTSLYYDQLNKADPRTSHYRFNYNQQGYLLNFVYTDTFNESRNEFTYQDGNISSINTYTNGKLTLKRDYQYDQTRANTLNLAFVESFQTLPFIQGGLLGKPAKNLLRSITCSGDWHVRYEFNYEFDTQGKVIKIIRSDDEIGESESISYDILYE